MQLPKWIAPCRVQLRRCRFAMRKGVLTLPSLPRNAVRVKRHTGVTALNRSWPVIDRPHSKTALIAYGVTRLFDMEVWAIRKTHGESQGILDNRQPRDGNRELGNLLQNPIRHFLNWMLSAEIVFRFAEMVCTLPTSALTSKLNEWSAKIECTMLKVGVSTPNKVR